jgi:hypothetical protein
MLSQHCCRRSRYLLEILDVCRLLEVLQVAEIGDKVRLVEHFLHGQIIEIHGICKALYKLGGHVSKEDWQDAVPDGPRVQARSENILRTEERRVTRSRPY